MDTPRLEKFWIHFWVQDQKLWNGHPKIGKNFEFISEFRFKSCGMDTPEVGKIFEVHFWVQDQMLWNGPPESLEKNWSSFLSSGSKVVEWIPQFWNMVQNFWKFYFLHMLSNDACKLWNRRFSPQLRTIGKFLNLLFSVVQGADLKCVEWTPPWLEETP